MHVPKISSLFFIKSILIFEFTNKSVSDKSFTYITKVHLFSESSNFKSSTLITFNSAVLIIFNSSSEIEFFHVMLEKALLSPVKEIEIVSRFLYSGLHINIIMLFSIFPSWEQKAFPSFKFSYEYPVLNVEPSGITTSSTIFAFILKNQFSFSLLNFKSYACINSKFILKGISLFCISIIWIGDSESLLSYSFIKSVFFWSFDSTSHASKLLPSIKQLAKPGWLFIKISNFFVPSKGIIFWGFIMNFHLLESYFKSYILPLKT